MLVVSDVCYKSSWMEIEMFLGLLFGLGFVALCITVAVVLVIQPRRPPFLLPPEHLGLVHLRRVGAASRLLGLVAGLAVLVPLGYLGRLGQGLVLVPASFAVVQILGVLVAEIATRRDAREPGLAGLETRRVRDYWPRALTVAALVTGLVLSGVIGWTTAVASPDDTGRPGRAMFYICSAECDFGSFSPWPGSFYTTPLAIGLAITLVLGVTALIVVARRPRNGAEAGLVVLDDAIRRQSASLVLAALQVASAGSLAGIGLTAGPALLNLGSRAPAQFIAIGWLLIVLGVLALGALCWAGATLLRPLVRPSIVSTTRRSAAITAEAEQ